MHKWQFLLFFYKFFSSAKFILIVKLTFAYELNFINKRPFFYVILVNVLKT